MARSPIARQNTVGGSSPSSGPRDTFSAARVDTQGADRLARLSSALGVASGAARREQEAAQQAELDAAEREVDQGIAQGMINDGTSIRNGEMDPADSAYFRRGVEIGRARASALQMGIMLDERRQRSLLEGEAIPTDPEAYIQWREDQLTEIQEEMGIDPDLLSPAAFREYAGSLTEVRNQDGQRQRAFANTQLREEAYEQVDIELISIWQGHQDSESALEATRNLLTSARARGLDGTDLKQRSASAVISEANRQGNPQLLDVYMENTEFMSAPLLERLTDERRTLANRLEAERKARLREQEDAADTARQDMLDAAALQLAGNPYAPMPPEVIQSGSEAVTQWQRLQNAFVTNKDLTVHPVIQAAVLDGIYGTARQDGGGASARQELDDALRRQQITPEAFARASQQIRAYEQNAGYMNDPMINRARGRLEIQPGIQGMGGDALQRLENDRQATFDALVLDALTEWRMGNPEAQVIPQSVLIEIGAAASDRVMDLSTVDSFAGLNGTDQQRAALRRERDGSAPQEERADAVSTPNPPGLPQ